MLFRPPPFCLDRNFFLIFFLFDIIFFIFENINKTYKNPHFLIGFPNRFSFSSK